MRRRALLLAVVVVAACGGDDGSDGGDGVTVFAAASLTAAFTEMADHLDGEVTYNFAGSQQLVAQLGQGAEADVIATADEESMAALDVEPLELARNRLAIVVEPGNPLRIRGLADLARPDVTLVLAAPEVPAGRSAAEVLERAGVDADPRSFEENVTAVVTRVALGEADAGIAYVTDVAAAADEVDAVEIPADENVDARYPIAVLDPAGQAFVDFTLSPDGQAILADHGFLVP